MSSPLLMRSSWRFFTRHPWQLGLTLLSIALGAAVIIAVGLANQTAAQSFGQSINALSGNMTHSLSARQGRIPDDFYRQLRLDWGYHQSAPQVEVKLEYEGLAYTLLGLDPFAMPLNDAATIQLDTSSVTRLMTEANTVIAARGSGLQVGTRLAFEGRDLRVIGLADLSSDSLLLSDIATAQGSRSGLSRIQLQLSDHAAKSLQQRLPANYQLQALDARQQVFSQMTQAFRTNLLAMSLLAMLVGAFLVYNTMTFSVLQRRRSFAIARMVGVTAGQLFRHLLLEALLLGLLGAVLGVVLGVVLGQGLLVLVTQTLNDLYVEVSASDLLLDGALLLQGLAITLSAVLLATLAPAWEAARISPVHVQRPSTLERHSARLDGKLALGGLVLMLCSAAVLYRFQASLVWGFIGLFLLIAGYSLCLPWVLRTVLRALQALSQQRATLLMRMALRSVEASLSRTSLSVIALAVAVSATVGVSVMIGSFRASVADWLSMTLSSDIYIAASSDNDNAKKPARLNPAWLERVQSLPELASVSTGRALKLEIEQVPTDTLVMQVAEHSAQGFHFLSGDKAQIWPAFVQGDGLVVSEPFAYHQQIKVGDSIAVPTPQGEVSLPILGVFQDYSSTQGLLVMTQALYQRYWQDDSISSIGLALHDAAASRAVEQQLKAWAPALQAGEAVEIRSNEAIRDYSLAIFDRTFAITQVLRVLVIGVAFVGVFSALMALFLEKQREFAILRATGLTPKQLQGLVLGQSALLGVLAGLLALPLGYLMAVILIDIINQRSFGWTMQTYFFAGVPLQAVLLALVAALLASWYPVRRMARLQIRESLYA